METSPTAFTTHRVDPLRRMLADAVGKVDAGRREDGFNALLLAASAALDRLQLLGPSCLKPSPADAFDAAAAYVDILRTASSKLSALFLPPRAPHDVDAALQAVADAIAAVAGGLAPEDEGGSPTTATQQLPDAGDRLPKFEVVVTETAPAAEPEAVEADAERGAQTGAAEQASDAAPEGGDGAGTPSRGRKMHLEVDTESAKKKRLDKRTSKEKLADAIAEALEGVSEARSPADDWVLAGSPSVSMRSLLNSRQGSSATIIRKPKVLPPVVGSRLQSPAVDVGGVIAVTATEGAAEATAEQQDELSVQLVDDSEPAPTPQPEPTPSSEDPSSSDPASGDPAADDADADVPPGPWSASASIAPSLAGSEDHLAAIPARGSSIVIPLRGQSLLRGAFGEHAPPARKDSLRSAKGGSPGEGGMRRCWSMERTSSMTSFGYGTLKPEKRPSTIQEAQGANQKIWNSYQSIIAEHRAKNEPIPEELAWNTMHSMIQTFAEAREQWDRMKPRRFGPGANETNLPPLPRNLSSRGSPNTKSPGLDSAVSDTSNVSPHSTDSAATAVPTSARSPAFDLTPSGDDPVPEEVRQKRLEQCAMIVREIYETELTFKDNMGILTGALGQQMRSAAANPDGPLLPLFDVETIFKHAPDLLIFSHSLCNEFRAASERFVEDQSAIGRVFANNFGGFDIFIRFVTNYSRAKATIRRNERDSAQFKKFLAERQSSPECKKQDIHSYLIMPIQRAMRYYLLLHTLLKKMDPANTEAYNLIENACLYMNEISQIMNCMQQQEEEFNGLFEMHDLVEYCPDTILSATRRLEKSFVCEDLGKHKRHMKLFVLTDLVIFARMKKDSKDDYDAVLSGEKDQEALAKGKRRYALKEMCFNNHIRVQEAKDGDDASILRVHLVNPFRIDGDGKRKEKVVSRRTSTSSKARSSSLAAQRNNSTVTQRSSSAHRSNSATPQKTGKWPFSKPVAEVAVPEADNECDDDADSFSIAPSIVPSELSSRAASPSRRPDEAADVSRAGTMRSMAESTAVGGDVSRAGTMRSTAETASNGTEIARVGTMRSIAESAASNRTSIYVDDAASVFENVDDDSEIVSLSLKFQDGAAREDIVRLIRQLSTVPMVRRDFVGEFVL